MRTQSQSNRYINLTDTAVPNQHGRGAIGSGNRNALIYWQWGVGSSKRMVEAILWDNDGVLVDTECLFFESTRRTLATIGIQLSLEQFLELSMRQGRSAFDLAIERGWTKEQLAHWKCERDLLYSEMLRHHTRVLPGVTETLKQLHGRVRMAVVTSSQRQHFDAMHADIGLRSYFEFVLAREDCDKTKPNPEPYLLALERLRMRAEDCVAVEDSERGLAAARAAGLRCLVIPNEITRRCSFQAATAVLPGAAAVLDAVTQL
jgi:HAD superfamily hydrolase (TIGR01509 family)